MTGTIQRAYMYLIPRLMKICSCKVNLQHTSSSNKRDKNVQCKKLRGPVVARRPLISHACLIWIKVWSRDIPCQAIKNNNDKLKLHYV